MFLWKAEANFIDKNTHLMCFTALNYYFKMQRIEKKNKRQMIKVWQARYILNDFMVSLAKIWNIKREIISIKCKKT